MPVACRHACLFIGLHFVVKIHFDRPQLAHKPHIFSFHRKRYRERTYEVCSKSITNFEFPRVTYIRFSIFLWRYVGTHISHDFCLFQKMDQRICIKFCVKNKIKCADAFRMLTVAYGEATLDRSNVYRW